MGPGLSREKNGNWSQNSPILVLIFGVVYHVYTLSKVVSHYDLKKVWIGGGWVG